MTPHNFARILNAEVDPHHKISTSQAEAIIHAIRMSEPLASGLLSIVEQSHPQPAPADPSKVPSEE